MKNKKVEFKNCKKCGIPYWIEIDEELCPPCRGMKK